LFQLSWDLFSLTLFIWGLYCLCQWYFILIAQMWSNKNLLSWSYAYRVPWSYLCLDVSFFVFLSPEGFSDFSFCRSWCHIIFSICSSLSHIITVMVNFSEPLLINVMLQSCRYLKLLCRFHPFERIKEISFGKLFWHFIHCKVRWLYPAIASFLLRFLD